MIGDGQSAALLSQAGSIDWLCWPRFDSDACFAALLGREEHGFWRLAPLDQARSDRRYQTDTLVLETEFTGREGRALLIDFMPVRDQGLPVLARIVRGLSGRVRFRSEVRQRFNCGSAAPWSAREGDVIVSRIGPDMTVLHANVDVHQEGEALISCFEIGAGEEVVFTLQYLAEEYDVEGGRLAGNFPQTLTHPAVVRTGLTLSGPVGQRGGTSEGGDARR